MQVWCELYDLPMTGISRQPHLLARAQSLDTWAVARERAIAALICKAEALETYDFIEKVACFWHAISRLQESSRREHAQAAALRATWDRRGKTKTGILPAPRPFKRTARSPVCCRTNPGSDLRPVPLSL